MRHRAPDWQKRLRDTLARYRGATVVCGSLDCGTLWADAVLAVTGVDRLAEFRGTYDTEDGALRALAKAGFASASQLADALFTPVLPGDLHRGDLGFAPSIMTTPLASPAILDAGHAITVGPAGLVAVPRSLVTHGWAV